MSEGGATNLFHSVVAFKFNVSAKGGTTNLGGTNKSREVNPPGNANL